MTKKYVVTVFFLLIFFMFVSTSSASFLFVNDGLYERLPKDSVFKSMVDRFTQGVPNNENSRSVDTDGDDMGFSGVTNVFDDSVSIDDDGEESPVQGVLADDDKDGEARINHGMGFRRKTIIIERFEQIVNVIAVRNVELGRVLEKVIDVMEQIITYAPGVIQVDVSSDELEDNVVLSEGMVENNVVAS
ncbi:MAG: hypothetical protein QXS02_00905 [Candidatus Thermoplasmatota archaeon]